MLCQKITSELRGDLLIDGQQHSRRTKQPTAGVPSALLSACVLTRPSTCTAVLKHVRRPDRNNTHEILTCKIEPRMQRGGTVANFVMLILRCLSRLFNFLWNLYICSQHTWALKGRKLISALWDSSESVPGPDQSRAHLPHPGRKGGTFSLLALCVNSVCKVVCARPPFLTARHSFQPKVISLILLALVWKCTRRKRTPATPCNCVAPPDQSMPRS